MKNRKSSKDRDNNQESRITYLHRTVAVTKKNAGMSKTKERRGITNHYEDNKTHLCYSYPENGGKTRQRRNKNKETEDN